MQNYTYQPQGALTSPLELRSFTLLTFPPLKLLAFEFGVETDDKNCCSPPADLTAEPD